MNVLKALGRFAYDFVIGDDWKIAAAVVSALALGAVMLLAGLPTTLVVLGTAGLLAAAFTAAMVIDLRR